MARVTGSYAVIKTHDETVRAFVPAPLPPAAHALDQAAYLERNRLAEVALARLTGMAGLVASKRVADLQRGPARGAADLTTGGNPGHPDRRLR